jgi:hypothetical protein
MSHQQQGSIPRKVIWNLFFFSSTSWLRHYATNRKVAGSIPDEVIEFFLIYLILPNLPEG